MPLSETPEIDPHWLADRLNDRSVGAIAADVGQLIRHGDLPTGARLPTVRTLAEHLRVSPATVSSAWQRLRSQNLISGSGRSGMHVAMALDTPRPERYAAEGDFSGSGMLDLRLSVPDPSLLPDLAAYFRRLGTVANLNDYARVTIADRLRDALTPRWSYPPRTMLAANGGYEALMLAVYTFVRAGDRVLVEDPSPPRMLDIIEGAGARPTLIPRDASGIRPASLAETLHLRPAALVLQPGIHNPDGAAMTATRRDEIAEILRGTDVLVLEDDGLGPLAADPVVSLATRIGEQTLHIQSYSKSHGPDLRIAVLDGPEDLVSRVQFYRAYGSGWTSRVLQEVLAVMLTDPACDAIVEHARRVYNERRDALADRLAAHGIRTRSTGLDLWVPVEDEKYALVTCAAHGLAVKDGSRFTGADGAPHVRVSTTTLDPALAARVADILAKAV